MERSVKQFVNDTLLPACPPAVPLRLKHWAGLAFDRNRYPDWAPSGVWDALLCVHSARTADVAVISSCDLAADSNPILIPADREALVAHLAHEFQFTSDHYVFSSEQNWICRLGQDVTLMTGEALFMRQVVERNGGLDSMRNIMTDDFDPGPKDPVGLLRYLTGLTQKIRDWA